MDNQVSREKQLVKQQLTAEHLRSLKKQIEIGKQKKSEEEALKLLPMGTIFPRRSSVVERECDSCEKKFPQDYLTRVVEPFEV